MENLMGEDEAGTLERLKTLHKDLVQPKIKGRGGRIHCLIRVSSVKGLMMSIYGRIGARALGCAFMLCVWCSAASAFCFAPTAPEPPWGGPPRAPNCGPNGCSEWEIDHFRKKVEAYIEALQEYASEAGQFANEAAEYARCQADVAAEKLDKFIGE